MRAAAKQEIDLGNPEDLTPAADAILGANPFVGVNSRDVLNSLRQFATQLAAHPDRVGARLSDLMFDLMRVATGTSDREPESGDRRFADPAFADNPYFRGLMQGYLAWRAAMHDLVGLGTEVGPGEDWKVPAQERFAVTLLTEALAPTNLLAGNPAALKRAFETAGMSLVRGLRNLADDLINNGGMPAQVDRRPFEVGRNIAVTPGVVVHRGRLC